MRDVAIARTRSVPSRWSGSTSRRPPDSWCRGRVVARPAPSRDEPEVQTPAGMKVRGAPEQFGVPASPRSRAQPRRTRVNKQGNSSQVGRGSASPCAWFRLAGTTSEKVQGKTPSQFGTSDSVPDAASASDSATPGVRPGPRVNRLGSGLSHWNQGLGRMRAPSARPARRLHWSRVEAR